MQVRDFKLQVMSRDCHRLKSAKVVYKGSSGRLLADEYQPVHNRGHIPSTAWHAE